MSYPKIQACLFDMFGLFSTSSPREHALNLPFALLGMVSLSILSASILLVGMSNGFYRLKLTELLQ